MHVITSPLFKQVLRCRRSCPDALYPPTSPRAVKAQSNMALLDIALWISFALMMAPTGLAVVKGPVEMVGALVPGIPSADLATPFADHVLHIDMVRARGQRAAVIPPLTHRRSTRRAKTFFSLAC